MTTAKQITNLWTLAIVSLSAPISVTDMQHQRISRTCSLAALLFIGLGCFAQAATLPAVTDEAPAAGKRVRITAPEWVGSGVYHTLYLPTDWEAGSQYPLIVEWAPNSSGPFAGTVEDTQLGFYQSGGTGYIWVTMPFPSSSDASSAVNAVSWWGSDGDAIASQRAADYTRINVARILEDYGGDPSAVFATGFSRGSLAIGHIGHWDDDIADIWLGYLPLGQLDGFNWTTAGDEAARFAGMSKRPSFVTYGELDGHSKNPASTPAGITAMERAEFPVEWHVLAGTGHTDEWITDANGPVASSNAPSITDVRVRLRAWLSETVANRPGTSGVSGSVTDSGGSPLAGARIQSGTTHWTFSDSDGNYTLPGLIDGSRDVTVSLGGYMFPTSTLNVVLAGTDLTGRNFSGLLGDEGQTHAASSS